MTTTLRDYFEANGQFLFENSRTNDYNFLTSVNKKKSHMSHQQFTVSTFSESRSAVFSLSSLEKLLNSAQHSL